MVATQQKRAGRNACSFLCPHVKRRSQNCGESFCQGGCVKERSVWASPIIYHTLC
nr:MAG TPA: protein of unknown function DUF4801 [Caudoviricetes sp.]